MSGVDHPAVIPDWVRDAYSEGLPALWRAISDQLALAEAAALGRLRPWGCIERIRNPDGSLHCWHGDTVGCVRTGHETITTYYLADEAGE